jgi:hypothetical protein
MNCGSFGNLSAAPAVAMETSSFKYKTDVTLMDAACNNKNLVENSSRLEQIIAKTKFHKTNLAKPTPHLSI